MMRHWLTALLAAASAGCIEHEQVDADVFDSTGVRFHLDCLDASCTITVLDEDPPPLPRCGEDDRPGYGFFLGRFVAMAGACIHPDGYWGSNSDLERPLACDDDLDCPTLLGKDLTCAAGLCQRPERAGEATVDWYDAMLLCLGPVPRAETIDPLVGLEAHLAAQALADQACGGDPVATDCTLPLPDGCLQPR